MKVDSNILLTEDEIRTRFSTTLENVQEDLSLPNPEYAKVSRFSKGRFHRKVDKTICYLKKSHGEYIVPRYYFGELDAHPNDGRELSSEKVTSFLEGFTLRDYQEEFISNNRFSILNHTGILLEASCGSGKTILALYLSALRKRQTLIVVPTYYLAQQWEERIKEFTDFSVYTLKSTDTQIPTDSDFTIGVLDIFTCRELPKDLINNIGHIVLDEAHRMGAETYLPIIDIMSATYRTALTATFRRKDGVHKILKYHFGEHLFMPNRFPKPAFYPVNTGVVVRNIISRKKVTDKFYDFLVSSGNDYVETPSAIEFDSKGLAIRADFMLKNGSLNKTSHKEILRCISVGSELAYSTVDSFLNEHSGRRKCALSLVESSLKAGRTVLFLSKRKDILKMMNRYFAEYNPSLVISETTKRTAEEDYKLKNESKLILGVTQLAKEGLDIDRLDTLIIHLPMQDTEQAVGRISRIAEGKKPPTAFYLLDDFPMAYSVFLKAKKYININAELKGSISIKEAKSIICNL